MTPGRAAAAFAVGGAAWGAVREGEGLDTALIVIWFRFYSRPGDSWVEASVGLDREALPPSPR
jgi:hypothetical protein